MSVLFEIWKNRGLKTSLGAFSRKMTLLVISASWEMTSRRYSHVERVSRHPRPLTREINYTWTHPGTWHLAIILRCGRFCFRPVWPVVGSSPNFLNIAINRSRWELHFSTPRSRKFQSSERQIMPDILILQTVYWLKCEFRLFYVISGQHLIYYCFF